MKQFIEQKFVAQKLKEEEKSDPNNENIFGPASPIFAARAFDLRLTDHFSFVRCIFGLRLEIH